MKMKPIGDLVLLDLDEIKETTQSGIILMEDKSGYINARVASIGPGLFTATGDRIPMTVAVDDTVMIHKNDNHEGKNVVLDGKKYLLVRESEIALVSV